MSDSSWKDFEQRNARRVSEFDQALQGHKDFRFQTPAKQREEYREALEKVAEAQEAVDAIFPGKVKFYMSVSFLNPNLQDCDLTELYVQSAPVSVLPLLDAWDQWEQGNEFAPPWHETH